MLFFWYCVSSISNQKNNNYNEAKSDYVLLPFISKIHNVLMQDFCIAKNLSPSDLRLIFMYLDCCQFPGFKKSLGFNRVVRVIVRGCC